MENRNNSHNSIERRVKDRVRRERIQDIVLMSLNIMAISSIFVAPGASGHLFKLIEKYLGPKPKLNRRISQAITRLIEKGLVERRETKDGTRLLLTEKGKTKATVITSLQKSAPKRWDKKWRIVIFDVWEQRKNVRDRLRLQLRKIGFIKIQQSVWVYPYPCEELFAFLRADLKLGKGILYIVAEEIENDTTLRRHFNLPIE